MYRFRGTILHSKNKLAGDTTNGANANDILAHTHHDDKYIVSTTCVQSTRVECTLYVHCTHIIRTIHIRTLNVHALHKTLYCKCAIYCWCYDSNLIYKLPIARMSSVQRGKHEYDEFYIFLISFILFCQHITNIYLPVNVLNYLCS